MHKKQYATRAHYFSLILLGITFFLTACGTTPGEANLETAATTPTIDTRSRFILPPDGRDTALTCQGISGKTAIRTLRISGGVRLDMITPTFQTLLSKFSGQVDIPFSRTRDANLSGGVTPRERPAFIQDSEKNVAVLPWSGVLRFNSPLQNLTPGDFLNLNTTMRIELIRPGAEPTGDFPRQRFLPVNSPNFNRLFTPVFGPVGLDGSNFSSPYFILVLEESKDYAAGRGYLLSNDILNPLSSNTFIFPDATYFEENGLGILRGPSVYATFNCRVNLIEP
jgi:hypothetical protein